jgi:hypothetical protein
VIPTMLDNAKQGELQRYKKNYKALNLITTALYSMYYSIVSRNCSRCFAKIVQHL